MTEDTSAPAPRRKLTPSQLPLREKAALFERLRRKRQGRPPSSWQQLAIEEGYAQRTLEHFYWSAMKLEKNADRRPQAEIADERAGRFIHARLTAMPPNRRWSWEPEESGEGQGETVNARARFRPRVPRYFVPPPLRREITLSQLPFRERADLFAELQVARGRNPADSWKYLEVATGHAQRSLEHFYQSAMKLEKNADKRLLAEILGEGIRRHYRARSTAAPGRQGPDRDSGKVGAGEAGAHERAQASTEAGRRARKAGSSAKAERSEALLEDERHRAEARDVERQRRDQELLARAEEMAQEAEEERRWEAEGEQLRERDPLRQLMEVWDPDWGPPPLDEPF